MEKPFNRDCVKIIDWVLKSVGIDVHLSRISFSNRVFTIFPTLCSTLSISLYIFNNRKHPNEVVITAAYMGSTCILLTSLIILVKNKTKILQMLRTIDAHVYKYPDEENIRVKGNGILNEENLMKSLALIFAYECFGFSLSIISPIIGFLITGKYESSMFPSSYPWKEEGIISTSVIFILQLLGVLSTFWIYYILQVVFTLLTIEFVRQHRRLGLALLSLKKRSEKNFIAESAKCFSAKKQCSRNVGLDKEYEENIKHCIEHHRQLWKLFCLFRPWFSLFFSVELAISAATFALVFYNLLTKWDPEIFLTIVGSSFNVMANVFSRCVIGEVFVEMNTEITNVIFYDIAWWELSTQNKNLLLLFHAMNECTIYNLSAMFIFPASYLIFSKLLRMSYSYFNIVHSTLSKK